MTSLPAQMTSAPAQHPPAPPRHWLAVVIRFVGSIIARCLYRVRTIHAGNVPARGGVLLLPNHITWIDAVVLQLACRRPICFLVYDNIYRQPLLHPILRLFGAIPISSGRARDGMRLAVERLRAGEVVCLFPEGAMTRTGTLLPSAQGLRGHLPAGRGAGRARLDGPALGFHLLV